MLLLFVTFGTMQNKIGAHTRNTKTEWETEVYIPRAPGETSEDNEQVITGYRWVWWHWLRSRQKQGKRDRQTSHTEMCFQVCFLTKLAKRRSTAKKYRFYLMTFICDWIVCTGIHFKHRFETILRINKNKLNQIVKKEEKIICGYI